MIPALSAVVCTLNRSGYLRKTLESLYGQTLPRAEYEVIVVDNGSTDDTGSVVESFRGAGNLRYLRDPVLGLSQARNTGWENARGDIVAYLDDDALAAPDWLERIRDRYASLSPCPASVGGRTLPIWETERPGWITRELEHHLGIVDWQRPPMFLAEDRLYLPGANVSYKRAVLRESGGFPLSLGRKGRCLLSNEELWMQSFIRSRGYPVWYDPAIIVHHHIRAERLTPSWFYERFYWQGISDVVLANGTAEWRGGRESRRPGLWRESGAATRDLLGYVGSLLSGKGAVVARCRVHERAGRIFSKAFPGIARVGLPAIRRPTRRESG